MGLYISNYLNAHLCVGAIYVIYFINGNRRYQNPFFGSLSISDIENNWAATVS